MVQSQRAVGPAIDIEKEAERQLAAIILQNPERKEELENHVDAWIEAFRFYHEHARTPGTTPPQVMSFAEIAGHLTGINFNYPVKIGFIPPPETLAQYQPPTTDGKFPTAGIGIYWAVPGQSPQSLGISDYGKPRDPTPGQEWAGTPGTANVKKTPWIFDAPKPVAPVPAAVAAAPASTTAPTPRVPALFSTAAPLVDMWSRRDPVTKRVIPVICSGGGQQICSPEAKNLYQLRPGQALVQAPPGKGREPAPRFVEDMKKIIR